MGWFVHADLDAFYASVEQLDRPEYRGKPVIVGGLPGDRRSVVSAASYEARAFGVRSAMPVAEAVRRCPGGIFVRGNMARYREKSAEVMAIFAEFSPDVRQISIDEAFLDITGTSGLFGPPEVAAAKIKARVASGTGLTVSVGLAANRYLAKMASGISKPDGLTVVQANEGERFMRSLPAGKIWGVGPATEELLARYGYRSGEDIYRATLRSLTNLFGKTRGAFLYRAVRGEAAAFEEERTMRTMSAERTFEFDIADPFTLESALFGICETLMWRLLDGKMRTRTVSLKIRYADFDTVGVRETRPAHVAAFSDLHDRILGLFREKYREGAGVRLLGAALLNLEPADAVQGELFAVPAAGQESRLEQAVLEINRKFPEAVLRRGRGIAGEDRDAAPAVSAGSR